MKRLLAGVLLMFSLALAGCGGPVDLIASQAKVEEPEAEISIDDILQSTIPQTELDEIGVEEKSEARRIVEKFVEDTPELAANLLRNWLNEDWD